MYHRNFYFLLLLLLFILITCKDNPTSSDNEKPVVSIVYPDNNSEFPEDTVITIEANASDNESVKEVKFYVDGELEFTDNTEPYKYEWDTNGKAGNHTISAKAYDANNNIGESEVLSIKINAVIINTPPTAAFIVSPSSGDTSTIFQFDASESWDNEDSISLLRFSWDWENDGIWDVENSTNYKPSHQYNSVGIYIVRFRVTDSGNLFDDSTKAVNIYLTGTVTDIDGNVYQTVKIGYQWWMAENIKVTHYRNGDAIPNVKGSYQWLNLTTGAYCNYDNNSYNVADYGRLYNWYAIEDSRNIAPAGWHVPSDIEWQILEGYLGKEMVVGGKMKETGTTHWNSPNTAATNESGFSALPGGYRYTGGDFHDKGKYTCFWSSTEYSDMHARYRLLSYKQARVLHYHFLKYLGFSIRCVKD